jgi:deoxyribonuclease-4
MIRIGQAGIPLSCKGRTNKDGLIYTKEILDLNAMEVQFVRGLYVMEEEEAVFMNEYAQENDVELYVHAPYYINLSDDEEVKLSFEKIMNSARAAQMMGEKINSNTSPATFHLY